MSARDEAWETSVFGRNPIGTRMDRAIWDVAYAAGLERASQIVYDLNADYRDETGLTAQRLFSVEARGAIGAEAQS